MFKKSNCSCGLALGSLLITACANGSGVDDAVGVAAQALDSCATNTGKWQHLANLAVATADEMGELNSSGLFTVVPWNGTEKVALSTYGANVCAARGGCPMVQEYLALQEMPNDVYVPQDIFNTIDYRNTIVDGYKRQVMQIDQLVANNQWGQLPEDNTTALNGPDGTATCGGDWYSFGVNRGMHLKFSSWWPIAGMHCTAITEPGDPHGWGNNYLCSERALGLRWSSSGPIANMHCINVNEPAESVWNDNYLCTPEDWGLTWSYNGIPEGKQCVAFNEPWDPNGWNDNYLCWDPSAVLNHPSTLCQELLLFGGAAQCQGNNPYLDFVVSSDGTQFKIDPTDYSSGSINTATSGTCVVSLPLVSTNPAVAGACCYQNGKYGYLVKYTTRAYTYYCRTS
jgi:hypothetical protein